MYKVSSLWTLLLALCAVAAVRPIRADDVPAARESDLKAAFIYNFAKFTTWPAGSFASPQAPLVMGVVGSDEIAAALTQQLKTRSVAGHPIEVRALTGSSVPPPDLHVLYVGMQADGSLPTVGVAFERVGLLTIGDSEAFMNRGGIVRFIVEAERLHFQVSTRATDRAGLKLSSQLLMLAKRAP